MCSCFKRRLSDSEEPGRPEEEHRTSEVEIKMLPAGSSLVEPAEGNVTSENPPSRVEEKRPVPQSRVDEKEDDKQTREDNFLELEVRAEGDAAEGEKNDDPILKKPQQQLQEKNEEKEVVLTKAAPSASEIEDLDVETLRQQLLATIAKERTKPLVENPFDPKYELWAVATDRAKVRIYEHRKSRKICEFPRGTVVRCVGRNTATQRFKIDLPLMGWCSSFHQLRDSQTNSESVGIRRAHVFKRVDPNKLAVVDSRFILEIKIGQGSFGKVYVAWDQQEQTKVAVKIDQPKNNKRSVFDREIDIMKRVNDCKRVPSLLWHGSISSHTRSGKNLSEKESFVNRQFMVLDLQGMSLSILWKNYITYFSLKTVLMLGIEIVRILEEVHSTGVLHRDIKPANFVISRGDRGRTIYILDFGLSVMYKRHDGSHIDYSESCRRCGTARYSSINTHKRIRQSRRDDLEAAGYVLLLFLRDLPWKQKKGESPEKKWKRILYEKTKWTPSVLCSNFDAGVRELFVSYFDYCRNLEFKAKPNYDYLSNLFARALAQRKLPLDFMYDWVDILFAPSNQ